MTMRSQRGPSLDLPEELNRLLQGTSVSENVLELCCRLLQEL